MVRLRAVAQFSTGDKKAELMGELAVLKNRERKRVRRDVSINININGATPTDEYLQCPISHEIMTDPVVASDGHTYERNNIKEWLRRDRVSPITNLPMDDWLTPNYAIKSIIANRV